LKNDKRFVRDAFAAIAPRYDLLNALLSFGIEAAWRRKTVACLAPARGERILDLCAGTLTLSRDAARRQAATAHGNSAPITSVDLCLEMLVHGRARLTPREEEIIFPVCGDAESLPLDKETHDAAFVTYGVRNLADADAAFREIYRVLKPSGRLVILEFTRPRMPVFAFVYSVYLRHILPLVGGIISGSPFAYRHLSDSIQEFMTPEELLGKLDAAGFEKRKMRSLSMGIAGIFSAQKPI